MFRVGRFQNSAIRIKSKKKKRLTWHPHQHKVLWSQECMMMSYIKSIEGTVVTRKKGIFCRRTQRKYSVFKEIMWKKINFHRTSSFSLLFISKYSLIYSFVKMTRCPKQSKRLIQTNCCTRRFRNRQPTKSK